MKYTNTLLKITSTHLLRSADLKRDVKLGSQCFDTFYNIKTIVKLKLLTLKQFFLPLDLLRK